MLTILSALVVAALSGLGVWYVSDGSLFLAIVAGMLVFIIINIAAGKFFMKKLRGIMSQMDKDIKSERYDAAIEKLKSAYPYCKWQIMLEPTLNSQIGAILYTTRRFDEALPYLEKSNKKNWLAMSMLAAYYYREKNYEKALEISQEAIVNNRKEPFPYSLRAWMLVEQGRVEDAIVTMNNAEKALPLDEKIAAHASAVKNNKKIKMQSYGAIWLQLHMSKVPEGAKAYQSFIANQKIRRR